MIQSPPTRKLHRFEVDQSIRVEEMNKTTVISLANREQSFTLGIPIGVKRRIRERFRREGRPKQFGWKVFTATIILAVQHSGFRIQELVIDLEYPGYERNISEMLNKHLPAIAIYFASIGRKSAAHFAAYGVYSKKAKADMVLNTKVLLEVLKNGSRTVTPLDKSQTIRSPR